MAESCMGKPHFLLLPYSQQGHINPMLSLASQLAALGCKVTFVKAEKQAADADADADADAAAVERAVTLSDVHAQGNDVSSEGLQFVELGSRTRPSATTSVEDKVGDMKAALDGLEARQALIAELVEESKASAHPISCIICDFFMWQWVADLARKHCLQAALLWTSCGLSFYELFLEHKRKGTGMEAALSSFPSREHGAARYGLIDSLDRAHVLGFLDALFEGVQDSGLPILVNSSELLEAPIVEAVAPLLPSPCPDLRFIGPCLPAWDYSHGKVDSRMAQRAGIAARRTEEEACLPWLDQQLEKSVLFVSLIGSEGGIDLPKGLVEEIAMGIEESGYKCLWVVRQDALASCRPSESFQQRMAGEGRAMFVAWAPQKKVLQHAAVGGFLTHSGWNSTVESLSYGVPMLCLPLRGDQPLHAFLVYSVWQAGLSLISAREGSSRISKSHVQGCVRSLMDGRFAARLSDLRQIFMSAQQDAQHTLASFVQGVNSGVGVMCTSVKS